MAEFSATVTGAKEIEANLIDLGNRLATKALRVGIREGAQVIQEEAQAHAPVDTGALKEGIRVATKAGLDRGRVTEDLGIVKLSLTITDLSKGVLRAIIGLVPSVFYGLFQEFGTRSQPARPFLRPALDIKAKEAVNRVAIRLREEIKGFQAK